MAWNYDNKREIDSYYTSEQIEYHYKKNWEFALGHSNVNDVTSKSFVSDRHFFNDNDSKFFLSVMFKF